MSRLVLRLVGYVVAVTTGLVVPARAADEPVGVPATNPLDAISADSLSAFRTRPLFAPSRAEPPVPQAAQPEAVAAPPPPPPEPPPLKLVGIIGGSSRIAVVRLGDGAKARMLASGDMVDDWRVTVLDTAVRLTSGDRSVEIALFHAAPSGARSAPKPGEPPSDPAAAPPDPTVPPPE